MMLLNLFLFLGGVLLGGAVVLVIADRRYEELYQRSMTAVACLHEERERLRSQSEVGVKE